MENIENFLEKHNLWELWLSHFFEKETSVKRHGAFLEICGEMFYLKSNTISGSLTPIMILISKVKKIAQRPKYVLET